MGYGGSTRMRVLLADGQDARRLGLRLMLAARRGVEVVGEAKTADEALRLAAECGPDVVVLDPGIERGGGSTLWLCMALKLHSAGEGGPPKVLLFGGAEDLPERGGLEHFYGISGAESFVEAGEDGEALLEALGRTHAGERVFLPGPAG